MQHEDFGEKIGGAKKDIWKERGLYVEDLDAMNEREAEKFVKKDNIWKKPDYIAMLEEGIPLGVVYFIKKARDALAATPQYLRLDNTPEKRLARQKEYIETVRELQIAVSGVRTVEEAMKAYDHFFVDNGYLEQVQGWGSFPQYRATAKGRENPAITNKLSSAILVRSVEHFDRYYTKKAQQEEFGVPKDQKAPKGYAIHFNDGKFVYAKYNDWKPNTYFVTKKVLMTEKFARVQPTPGQELICHADCGGVPESNLNIQLVQVLQKRAGNTRQNILKILLPILAHQLLGDGLQLIGQTALIGDAVLLGESSGHGIGMFLPVLPKIWAAAAVPAYIDSTETEVHHYQAELNRLYDNFAKRFGRINDKINERAFSQDSSYYLLCALEILDDDGKFDRKSDMFTKRTIYPHQEITHVATATEALAVSLGERARVDIPFMSELTGKTEEEVISELQGQIYRVPLKEPHIYQIADEYLSGNVREKLKVAEAAATADTIYNINVSALAAVQPKDLDASEIAVRLGTDWIDQKYIEQFMLEVLKTPAYAREYVHVQYSPIIHAWNISNKTHIRKDDVAAHSTYGTTRVSAYKLLEDALNLQNTKVFDTKEDAEGNEKRVLNAKETTLAQQKQTMLKLEFQDWIWRDPDRRQTLVRKYNDEMNCIRPRQYDGSHLVLAGMNPEIQLEEHQKNAIARAVYGGNTLLAHCVGAGKTFEITASAMEMKRLGLCSKSMIVVPNHLTQQWASEFLRLYPNANILVTTKRDFEKDRRKKFCSRIATGDYDAVIIGYSQFEKIPVSKVRQIRLLRDQIADISKGIEQIKMENGERFSKKQLERTKKSLKVRLEKLQADHRKDTVINFEELGIDRLFVDESDSFKNLFLVTKMQNVAGLSTSDAQKSSDMFNKTRYLDEITGYKGVIFATGTPISNSITEMFTVQRYLQYDALEAMHMEHFDSWASRFGETVTTMELAPEGTGYRPRERFAKFFNLPELMNIFHEVADIKTEDMLDLPTPEVEFHNIVAKPTEFQKAYVQKLSERATAVRVGNVDPTEDNMLKITNDGRKLGLDQRLISPLAEDEPDSKINICVENIMKYWEDGKEEKLTQLVFSDLSTPKKDGTFNVYDDIKQKLMERGVPENEVAFIHDAESEVKKKELFSKVRSGKVRVLIGSTQKLGAGTNIQDRLIALHHLDVPWRPRDLTQREGRIKRRGNQNDVVHVFRYVTEGTFDAYLYQTVEKKQQFIGQIMTSKSPARTCDDVDEAALSYAEVKALCAGDPRIKERMELDVDVARLQVMQASHRSQQYNLEDKLRKYFPQEKQRLEWRIEGIQKDLATLAEHPLPSDGYIGIELLGQRFDERKAAGVVLLNECKKVQVYTTVPVGEYRGLKLFVKKQTMYSEVQIVLKGALEYTLDASDSDIGNIIRIDKVPEHLPEELSKAQASLENVMQQIESAEQEVGKPFPQEQELKDKLARITELDVELKMDAESPSAMPREEISSCNCNEPVAL